MEFASKYYEAPALNVRRANWKPMDPVTKAGLVILGGLIVLFIACAVIVTIIVRHVRRKRNALATIPNVAPES